MGNEGDYTANNSSI